MSSCLHLTLLYKATSIPVPVPVVLSHKVSIGAGNHLTGPAAWSIWSSILYSSTTLPSWQDDFYVIQQPACLSLMGPVLTEVQLLGGKLEGGPSTAWPIC